MNWKLILSYIPYVFLIIANFLYLYINGFGPIKQHPKLFIYNLIFLILVGIVVIIKINLLLYSWFVAGEGDTKQKTKKAIKTILQKIDFVLSIFKKGNQRMMIKIFLWLSLWAFINRYIPNLIMGVMIGTYFQYKGLIQQRLKDELQKLDELNEQLLKSIMSKVPKYQNKRIQRN